MPRVHRLTAEQREQITAANARHGLHASVSYAELMARIAAFRAKHSPFFVRQHSTDGVDNSAHKSVNK